jgi:hypothetical protein
LLTEKEYHSHVERTLKQSLVVLIVTLGVLFVARDSLFFWGFAAGVLVGIINAFFLALRIDKVTLFAVQSPAHANAFMFMGFGTRWGLIMLACFLAVKTGWFSLIGLMCGFLAPTVLSTGVGIRDLLVLRGQGEKVS